MAKKPTLEDIVNICKRRGFIYQGSEIYGGLSGTWDYGPLGAQLKRNMTNLWWETFVEKRDDMYGIDTAILMNAKVWQASGHVETFNDPLVECSNCHMKFRADKIDLSVCPNCGKRNTFGDQKQFNLLFKTQVGPLEDTSSLTYLRGETAQGMFVNFKNVLDSYSPDLPFGLAQIGRTFRNEISPRDFIFRSREFEIMELEYFIKAKEWENYFSKWRSDMLKWFDAIGLSSSSVKEKEVEANDRAHYSKRTIDFLYDFPSLGFDEIGGLAYRTDFDLKNHQEFSGKNLEYHPKDGGAAFIPHVIEPTFGVDRNLMAVICESYTEDTVNGEKRLYLNFPYELAPVKVAVFPLLKNKPELIKKARELYEQLKQHVNLISWDDNGNIGKRYRRQDEIGTPYCITVDFESLKDNSVTLRHRNTTQQKRLKISDIVPHILN